MTNAERVQRKMAFYRRMIAYYDSINMPKVMNNYRAKLSQAAGEKGQDYLHDNRERV